MSKSAAPISHTAAEAHAPRRIAIAHNRATVKMGNRSERIASVLTAQHKTMVRRALFSCARDAASLI